MVKVFTCWFGVKIEDSLFFLIILEMRFVADKSGRLTSFNTASSRFIVAGGPLAGAA